MKSINLNIEQSARLKADDTTLEMIVKVLEKCNASLGVSQWGYECDCGAPK
jgi:hypothetical protein